MADFARKRSYRFAANAVFGIPWRGRDQLHTWLRCAVRRRSALASLWPFDLRNILILKASSRRLWIICKIYALVVVYSQDFCGMNYFLTDDVSAI